MAAVLASPPAAACTRTDRRPTADSLIVDFATARDFAAGMALLVAGLRRLGGLERVEWWAPDERGLALGLAAAAGEPRGRRAAFTLGAAGVLVVVGDNWSSALALSIARLAPLVRRRWTDDRLAEHAARLISANAALDDYATLVAGELKAPLTAAIRRSDAVESVTKALGLVDSLLAAARSDGSAFTRCVLL